eukprot:SAG11_NODE_706_length_7651_cov_4.192399_4_plen_97_part_00
MHAQVCKDPQLRANGAFEEVSHESGYSFETVAAPFNIHGANIQVRGPGPEPGAHTTAVMEQMLGMGTEEVAQLKAAGVLGYRPVEGTALANWTSKL